MEYTMQLVMILGTHVSGIDVSVDRSGWQRKRACSVALDAFPTVNGTGVSARGRPVLGAHLRPKFEGRGSHRDPWPSFFCPPNPRGGSAVLVRSVPLEGGTCDEVRQPVRWAPCSTRLPRAGLDLPCRSGDADLWFAESPAELERAKALCGGCPVRVACLAGALQREEPWGVWGGEIFERGARRAAQAAARPAEQGRPGPRRRVRGGPGRRERLTVRPENREGDHR